MTTNIYGNNVRVTIAANELTDGRIIVKLPDGYSYETIHVTLLTNIGEFAKYFSVSYDVYNFPPVRSHSPSTLDLYVKDTSQRAEIRFVIEKFGQIPDPNYFNTAFEPILVTGDDGSKHKVIPSDQFK